MALYINHNMMAMNAARNLGATFGELGTSTQRLSSGLRINSAADDAAGLAIRETQRADIAVLNQGIRNAGDAISMIQIADGALSVIDEKLIRMKELAEQAATGTYTDAQRDIIHNEYDEMAREITRIAMATDFNGRHLLDGALSGDGLTTGMKIHFGTGNDSAEDYYYIAMNNMTAEALGVAVGNLSQASITTQASMASQRELFGQTALASVGSMDANASIASRAAVVASKGSVDSQAGVVSYASRAATTVDLDVASQASVASAASYESHASLGSTAGESRLIATRASQASIALQDSQAVVTFQSSIASQVSIASHVAAGTVSSIASQIFNASQARIDSQAAVGSQGSQVSVASLSQYGGVGSMGSRDSLASEAAVTSQASIASRAAASGVSYASIASQAMVASQGSMDSRAVEASRAGWSSLGSVDSQASLTSQASVESQASVASQASMAAWGARLDTQDGAQRALTSLDIGINLKDNQRAELGAKSNRLENTITNLAIQAEMTQGAESRISDVDVATEMTAFTTNSILAQAGTAMLAQANALNRMAIQLIGG